MLIISTILTVGTLNVHNHYRVATIESESSKSIKETISKGSFKCSSLVVRKIENITKLLSECLQSKSNSRIDIILWGDSHARHLYPGLNFALSDANIQLIIGPSISSKKIDVKLLLRFLAYLQGVDIIILSSRWKQRIPADFNAEWKKEFIELDELVSEINSKVLLIEDNPGFPFSAADCEYPGILGKSICEKVNPTNPQFKSDFNYEEFFGLLSSQGSSTFYVPTRDLFCRSEICSMKPNGELLYSDWDHLNLQGSILVAKRIKFILAKAT